ncbi:MAG: BMP family protein [Planctomycetes bacterium]|nr:BMP family protein [Planctomycetota bacterium]
MNRTVGIVITVVLVAVLLWMFSRQAQTPSPDNKDGGKNAAETFKVALITPGQTNDKGWSEGAYDALQRIKKDLGAEVKNVVATDSTQAMNHFRAYASEGCDVVVGHASEWFGPDLLEIAERNPKTEFLISGSDKPAVKNVAGMRFVLEDACYVLGFIAGSMTKSKVLGCVGPEKVPVIQSTFDAFTKGAKAANPDAEVRIVWTEKGSDIPRAKELTLALIAAKADFIFHNANDGGSGVFQAVQEKKDEGVLTFGANADQSASAPDVILANAVIDVPGALTGVVKAIHAKKFDGKTAAVGMAEGAIEVVFNPALEKKMPGDVRKKVDELIGKLKKGEFKVERMVLK